MPGPRVPSRRSIVRQTAAIAAALLSVAALPATARAQSAPEGPPSSGAAPIDPAVQEAVDGEGTTDFYVVFDAKADLNAAETIADRDERGQYVVDQLQATATQAQAGARADLDARDTEHRDFWAVNAVLVRRGSQETLTAMATRPEVREIRAPKAYEVPEPEPGKEQAEINSVEWGVANINADDVWDTFGDRGEGIVIANIDTGVQFDHPALVDQYRGNNGDGTFDHDYSWFDAADSCPAAEPCDGDGHGSHTMGTMVGDDGGANQIGVAPGAKWIAANGCCPSDEALLSSGEWMLAPTDLEGENPDVSMRPHIVSNSWGAPNLDDEDPFFVDLITAWTASGIYSAFSNGNEGDAAPPPACDTSGSPGDAPESYSVGAYDIDNEIAVFSSRGPGGEGELKPNISAPGVNVRSSFPGDTYGAISGTSMAAPHVAATAALMWSAAPSLVGDVDATRALLDDTAVDSPDLSCGGTADDNNVFGEGRLDALAAVDASPRGAAGTLAGTVTDDLTGDPVGGAKVRVEGGAVPRTATTKPDGTYSLVLAAGTYDVAVTAYGYEPATSEVTVVPEATTTEDVALVALPVAEVSGTVTDGSGHGWPLYARIDIAGYPGGPVFTDPVTGAYSVDLIEETAFTFTVTALVPGYEPAVRAVTVPPDSATQDFALTTTADCRAPGYSRAVDGVFEAFDEESLPDGWEVVDNNGDGQEWRFDDPGGRGNLTGGEGPFAVVDSDFFGFGNGQDTELVTPILDLSDTDEPIVAFRHDFNAFGDEVADVDVSIDAGATWTNVWRAEGDDGDGDLRGPRDEEVAIPTAAGESEVQVRFHYYDANFAWWWEVDDVLVGESSCVLQRGGLLVGQVTDDLTGAALNGATVTSDDNPEDTATTVATPADPNLGDGRYILFSSRRGEHPFTASKAQYGSSTEDVTVVRDVVVEQDFALGAGQLVIEPAAIDESLDMGDSVEVDLTIENQGSEPASFELGERDIGFEIAAQRSGAPVRRVSGTFVPTRFDGSVPAGTPAARTGPADAPWEDIADLPEDNMDNLADTNDGLVYSVGGFDGSSNLASGTVYDPSTDSWDSIADMSIEREKPTGNFIDGLLYVAGGWDNDGGLVSDLEIYDPTSDSWSTGDDWPSPWAAAASVVLDGQLYTIGGCREACGTDEVWTYDPAADAWSELASYPEDTSWTACGAIDGLIYCGGGTAGDSELDSAYVYDRESDAWSSIASLPETRWAGGFAAVDGQLIISGGVTDNFATITNEGFAYDPGADTWSPIPNSNNVVYRGGSACGFYKVGGSTGGFTPTAASEVLPDFDVCGVTPDVPWLSIDPLTGTVPAGDSVSVTVTLDASVAEVDQPGAYLAAITVKEDTPYAVAPVDVRMDVIPPASWGKLEGTVTGLSRCDAEGGPLARATVTVEGDLTDIVLTTDADGHYAVWMDEANAPLSVTAELDGWVSETHDGIDLTAGSTTQDDFELRLDAPCASASPEVIELSVEQGASTTADLTLQNDGAGAYDFSIDETRLNLQPLGIAPRAFSKPVAVGPMSVRSTDAGARQGAAPSVPVAVDSWFGGADVPGGRVRYGHAQCDGDANHFYVFSGVDGEGGITDAAHRYDATTNTWTELAPVPAGSEGPTAACEAGRIHLMGGDGSDQHYVYDIGSDTWSAAEPLPRGVWGAAAAGFDGRIYLAGGDSDFNSGGTSDEVDVYDIATGAWDVADDPMRAPTVGAGHVQAGQHLYVVGGWDDDAPDENVSVTQRLNLVSGQWQKGGRFESARADFALAATDRSLYAIGGDEPDGDFFDATPTVERLKLTGFATARWKAWDDLQIPLVANSGGFCTEAIFGREVWTGAGATTGPQILGRTFFHRVAGERCPTIRGDVPWLSVAPATGSVLADDSTTVEVTVDATELGLGTHQATLLVTTTDPGAPELRIPVVVTVDPAPPDIFLSLEAPTTLAGIDVADEDIVGVSPDGFPSMHFDGSDVGIESLAVDAFAHLADGTLVLSFTQPGPVPGVAGTVDDSDLVRFVPSSFGPDTAGTFEPWFDGSDVALDERGGGCRRRRGARRRTRGPVHGGRRLGRRRAHRRRQ